jgi:hypothetical protein
MTKEDIRSMTFLDLLLHEVEDFQRAPYRDDIRRRLREDPNLKPYLASYQPPEELPWDTSGSRTKSDDVVPSPLPQGDLAKEMLSSSWSFSWFDSRLPPDQIKEFVTEVAKANYTGLAMSEQQWKLWLVIRSRYRRWLREQS